MKFLERLKEIFLKLFGKKQRKKPSSSQQFINAWTKVFAGSAQLFSGLYGSMYELSQGKLKRKSKVLKEWCQRVQNRLDGEAAELTEKHIRPLIDAPDSEKHSQLAAMLIKAAELGGVLREQTGQITVDETTFSRYDNLGEREFEVGDTAEVIVPAWVQNGMLIEKGIAKLN